MIDYVKIRLKAGDGGTGCNSFRGVKFTRSRHVDGGEGGRGADVVIKVNPNLESLEQFQYKQDIRAENGKPGLGNKKKGAHARPCVIEVPPGTIVRDIKQNLLLRDFSELSTEFVVAQGGTGGKGNSKTRVATPGVPGQERYLSLELKLLAEIGLIGYPNAGKSSLLAQISSSHPKVATYPFTTKSPFLAALNFEDFDLPAVLTVVELPGLIKGAHQGKGLGVQFLRHAERVKLLIHLVDMAAQEGRDPLQDYQEINQELKVYNQGLDKKAQIIVANKMDLPSAPENLAKFSAQVKTRIFPISALKGQGIEALLKAIKEYFR